MLYKALLLFETLRKKWRGVEFAPHGAYCVLILFLFLIFYLLFTLNNCLASLASYHIKYWWFKHSKYKFLIYTKFGLARCGMTWHDVILGVNTQSLDKSFIFRRKHFFNQKILSNLLSNDIIHWILCKIKI